VLEDEEGNLVIIFFGVVEQKVYYTFAHIIFCKRNIDDGGDAQFFKHLKGANGLIIGTGLAIGIVDLSWAIQAQDELIEHSHYIPLFRDQITIGIHCAVNAFGLDMGNYLAYIIAKEWLTAPETYPSRAQFGQLVHDREEFPGGHLLWITEDIVTVAAVGVAAIGHGNLTE